MIAFTPAKINIGLFVTGRREDGYHTLESIFAPIPWKDSLEIQPTDQSGIHLTTHGLDIPGSIQDNLIVKAYQLVAEKHTLPGLNVHLIKDIPLGAGLGGGSSNGAYMLRLLQSTVEVDAHPDQWNQWAEALGSDCPFFMQEEAAMVSGRGECIEPHPHILEHLRGWHIVVLHPGLHVSTREAFAEISPTSASFDLRKLTTVPVDRWKTLIRNDFQATVRKKHKTIDHAISVLESEGATYVQMTGTGSAVYGLFREASGAARALSRGAQQKWRVHSSTF